MAAEAVESTEGEVALQSSQGLEEGLLAISETLELWSMEGPPRNPRASAGALFTQVQGTAPAVAALVSEDAELRKRVGELEAQMEVLRLEAVESRRHAEELEVQLRKEAAALREREAAAAQAEEAAKTTEAELRGRLAEEEARAEERKAEIAELRAQNMALCAQVREGMPPVTVMCRVRPMESYGSQDPAILKSALSIDLNEMSLEDGSSRPRKFRMGRVLDGGVSQDDVFAAVAPLVETVTTGGSACIFAYGATGSGKTFTLEGGEKYGAAPGLAHHALRRLLEGPRGGAVQLSMVEVYCEQLRDLLSGAPADAAPANLQCPRRDTQGRLVLDCARCDVGTFAEAEELLSKGYAARAAGGTLCNERSSRSHVVLFATCMKMDEGTPAMGGQLVLVDLAGSENVQRSGADEDSKLLAEAKAINKSLSALADVVEATAKRQQFVPYRNSKLTMLLEESLTSAKVLMMVHVSPLVRDATDTGHSLNFAGRVQAVDFGAQRMRAEQEERLKSGLARLRKTEAELRKQNAVLTEQLQQARSKEPAVERSAQPAKVDEVRRRHVPAEQRGAPGRASPEPRSVVGRTPTPDPRTAGMRGRPVAEHEPSTRQRQPTPRPSRQTCEAIMAAQDATSDCEEQKAVRCRGDQNAEVREEQGNAPVASTAPKSDAGCEDGKARVLADITNIPAACPGDKEGKDPLGKSALTSRVCSDAICLTPERQGAALSMEGLEEETVWVDQELQLPSDCKSEGEEAAGLKSALKKEKTNFALKLRQRRMQLCEESLASTPSSRRVRFDDAAVAAKSPPRWYLELLDWERQAVRAREEEAGSSPAGDCCAWPGVLCGPEGEVLEVDAAGVVPEVAGGLEALEGLPALRRLGLPSSAHGDLRHLANLTALTLLDLNAARGVSGDLRSIARLEGLTELVLADTGVSGDLEALANLTALRLLDLTETQAAGEVRHLARMSQLQILYANGTSGISGDLSYLAPLSGLQALALGSTDVRGDLRCVERMSDLRELYLYAAPGVYGNINRLSKLVKLQEIDIRDTAIWGNVGDLSSLTALTKIDVASSDITGSIPETWTRMRILALYKTGVSGPLPKSIADWGDLTIFSAHLTSLSGKLPRLPPSLLSLSLYGARLSCGFEQADAWAMPGLSARPQLLLAGNAFSEFPAWLQASERQSFLLVDRHQTLTGKLIIFPLVFALLLVLLNRRGLHRVSSTLVGCFKPSERYVVDAHFWALKLLLGHLFAGILLVVFFRSGASFFECGDDLSKFSVAYFAESPGTEPIVVALWCLQLVISGVYIRGAPQNDGPTSLVMDETPCWACNKVLAATLWALVVLILCVPSALYVAVGCLPQVSRLPLGEFFKQGIRHACSIYLAIATSFIFPCLVENIPCFARLHSAKMLLFGSSLVAWSGAAATVAILDQDCAQKWVFFDQRCASPSDLEPLVGVNCSGEPRPWSCVVTTAEYCGTRTKFRQGRCVRAIVSKLTPLLLDKMLISAFIMPAIALVLLWWGRWEARRLGCFWIPAFDPSSRLSCFRQSAQLVTWLEVALVFGPLAPVLYPAVIAAVFTNLIVFRLAVESHGLEVLEVGQGLSRTYLGLSILAMCFFCSCFAFCEMVNKREVALSLLTLPASLLALRAHALVQQWRQRRGPRRQLQQALQAGRIELLQREQDSQQG